ncbi:MAG: pyridoxal phosphate-dependent aminotransferase, partial [Acidobacteriota bacterium]
LLDLKDRLQETALRRLRENLEFLRRSLAGHPAQVLRIGGGWSAVVRVPSQRTDEEWCLEWLEAHGVLVHPGSFFDFPSGDHVVVSLLTEPAAFETGVRLLLETLHAFD